MAGNWSALGVTTLSIGGWPDAVCVVVPVGAAMSDSSTVGRRNSCCKDMYLVGRDRCYRLGMGNVFGVTGPVLGVPFALKGILAFDVALVDVSVMLVDGE